MFSKGASIVGPITALGPIWLVYYLASSEVPKPVEVAKEVKTEDSAEKKQEKKTEEEPAKKEEVDEKKEDKKETNENETITKNILKTTSEFLNFIVNMTN